MKTKNMLAVVSGFCEGLRNTLSNITSHLPAKHRPAPCQVEPVIGPKHVQPFRPSGSERISNKQRLCEAAWKGDAALCQVLIDALGPELALGQGAIGFRVRTPLMWAAAKGHLDCVRVLLPHSDPEARDSRGQTALMHAALRGHSEIVQELVAVSDPDARAQGRSGMTALMFAVSEGRSSCVDILLAHGNPRMKSSNGDTLAMVALSSYGNFFEEGYRLWFDPTAKDIERALPFSDLEARNGKGQTAQSILRERISEGRNGRRALPDGARIFALLEAAAIESVLGTVPAAKKSTRSAGRV